ncbi:MAG TPA: hypothetical protein P5279_09560 [Anaerohalosphaeraceae bacterium]|nr:hypothetical protein [Anaerohalosphaeraceae bacterium]
MAGKSKSSTGSSAKPRRSAKRTSPKAATRTRPTARKRTSVKTKSTPRVTARKRTSVKTKSTPRVTARKRTSVKTTSTPRVTARKRHTAKSKSRPKVAARKSNSAKTKSTTRVTARKRSTVKAKSTTKVVARKPNSAKTKSTSRVTARKRSTVKAKSTTKVVARKRSSAKAKTTTKVTAHKPTSRTVSKGHDFDFNSWLLPTLELEQYEPHIEEEAGVPDNIKGSTRFAWFGAGQCGGRLVKSFYDLGYRKVLAVNTTHHDLDLLEIPAAQKFLMDIGERGAGKDMERGRRAVEQYSQEILHTARKTFGTQIDRIMVCFGAGGGTGSGSVKGLIEIAKRYARSIGIKDPNKKVGCLMTLPTTGEASSPMVAENAWQVATDLSRMAANGEISPLIIVDNDKVNKMYPGMTVRNFWPSINNTVAALFDIFNRLSAMSSRYTSFDPVDYHSIIESGGCAIMGLTKVTQFGDKFALSQAVKKNLEKTLLASGFNLSTAKLAGCIAVGGKKLMANVKGLQDNIDYAFDVLSEVTGNATIHRGIYEDNKDSLRVYTIIGGMDVCTERLEELRSRSAVTVG